MQAVLVSVITSLIVSAVTFVFGLKSGKNQADRSKLQDFYKSMYVGLRDIRNAIQENCPKKYINYESKTTGSITQYLPPVTKIFFYGDDVFLNKRVANMALNLERRCMTYGDFYAKSARNVHSKLLENLEVFKEGYKVEKSFRSSNGKESIKTVNPNNIQSSRLVSYSIVLSEQGRQSLKSMLEDVSYGISFETIEQGRILESTTIYPGGLKCTADEFICKLSSFVAEDQDKIEREKKELLKDCDKILKKLRRRSKEPVLFFETVFGAIGDIFH